MCSRPSRESAKCQISRQEAQAPTVRSRHFLNKQTITGTTAVSFIHAGRSTGPARAVTSVKAAAVSSLRYSCPGAAAGCLLDGRSKARHVLAAQLLLLGRAQSGRQLVIGAERGVLERVMEDGKGTATARRQQLQDNFRLVIWGNGTES